MLTQQKSLIASMTASMRSLAPSSIPLHNYTLYNTRFIMITINHYSIEFAAVSIGITPDGVGHSLEAQTEGADIKATILVASLGTERVLRLCRPPDLPPCRGRGGRQGRVQAVDPSFSIAYYYPAPL